MFKEFVGYVLTVFFSAVVFLFPFLDVDEGPEAPKKKQGRSAED